MADPPLRAALFPQLPFLYIVYSLHLLLVIIKYISKTTVHFMMLPTVNINALAATFKSCCKGVRFSYHFSVLRA